MKRSYLVGGLILIGIVILFGVIIATTGQGNSQNTITPGQAANLGASPSTSSLQDATGLQGQITQPDVNSSLQAPFLNGGQLQPNGGTFY